MKIVLFGEDSFTAIVLESFIKEKYDVLQVFCPRYNNDIYKRLNFVCNQNNIAFEIIDDFKSESFVGKIKQLQPDVIAICHFQKLISEEIIVIPKLGCLNLHPSLLPDYRGMAPQHWPIINGDKKTAVTVHFVDDGIDTGNIVMQREMEILEDDYVFDLQNRMKKIYEKIFVDAIKIINCKEKHIIQKHLKGSYYGRLKIKDCIIHRNMGVKDVYNLIKGVSFPYYGARFEDHIFWKAQIKDNMSNSDIRFEVKDKIGFLYLKDGCLIINKFGENE